MAVPTFEELFVPLTTEQFFNVSISVAEDIGLPATAWQPTSIGREVIYINSTLAASVSDSVTDIARGGFLDYAEGDWLTLLADQVYDVERIESTAADGLISLANSGASPETFAPGDVRVLNETQGKTYTNSTGGTSPAGGSISLEFQADEPGTDSNLVSGDTLSLETAYPDITPVYVEDLLGTDQELDSALRERCREANAQASPNGPPDAYDFYAKSATNSDGTNVGVTRTYTVQGDGTNTLYIADSDGGMTSTDVEQVQEVINSNVVPTGFSCEVLSAGETSFDFTFITTRSPSATASDAEVSALMTDAVTAFFASMDPGGTKANGFQGVYLSSVVDICRDAAGANVLDIKITAPPSDVALLDSAVPVLSSIDPGFIN